MLNGFSTNFPNDCMFDNGIIRVGSTNWGVTKGPSSFDPQRTIQNSDFDGKTVPLQLLDRLIHGEPIIQFTALEIGAAASGAQLAKLEPGSAEATTGVTPNTVTTITPLAGNQYLVSGNYLIDFRLCFERGIPVAAGAKKYACLWMPVALVMAWGPIQGNAKDHPTYQCKVVGRNPGTGDISAAAYKIELRESLP